MTDTDAPGPSGWLPLKDAAVAYGVSLRTMQRRVAAGEVVSTRVKTAKDREWRIRPPGPGDATVTGHDEPQPAPPPSSSDTTALALLARAEALLAPVVAERDRLRDEVNRLQEARLADAKEASAARITDAEEIGRLRGRMEALEAELERLRSAQAPPALSEATTARRRWPWQR